MIRNLQIRRWLLGSLLAIASTSFVGCATTERSPEQDRINTAKAEKAQARYDGRIRENPVPGKFP